LYVDDIILTASTTHTLHSVIDSLHREFDMTDLGDLHHCLGINVHRTPYGLFLSQQQYALELIERANLSNCNPISTPSTPNPNSPAMMAIPSPIRPSIRVLLAPSNT
jgi:hypothetical protein